MATLHSSKKNQTVFLINNYDLILKVFHEFNIQSEEVIKFSALVSSLCPRVRVRWCVCVCCFVCDSRDECSTHDSATSKLLRSSTKS